MRLVISIFTLILLTSSLFGQLPEVKVYEEFEQLEKEVFQIRDDKVHLINFWATWCKPCVKEMPYIDAMTEKYRDEIKVTLVSLDFPRQIDSKLIPFLVKNQIKSEVVLLDDGNTNVWIDKVDSSWSGIIPATLVLYHDKKAFYQEEFHSVSTVEAIIDKIKN